MEFEGIVAVGASFREENREWGEWVKDSLNFPLLFFFFFFFFQENLSLFFFGEERMREG